MVLLEVGPVAVRAAWCALRAICLIRAGLHVLILGVIYFTTLGVAWPFKRRVIVCPSPTALRSVLIALTLIHQWASSTVFVLLDHVTFGFYVKVIVDTLHSTIVAWWVTSAALDCFLLLFITCESGHAQNHAVFHLLWETVEIVRAIVFNHDRFYVLRYSGLYHFKFVASLVWVELTVNVKTFHVFILYFQPGPYAISLLSSITRAMHYDSKSQLPSLHG